MEENKLFVITGGPGVGKTTLLKALENKGFIAVPEDARQIIKQQMLGDGEGLPWKNKTYYSALMLKASLETYHRVVSDEHSEIVFFDRGILDTVCYMNMENIPIAEELITLVKSCPYHSKVFMLPPWEGIYETDTERKQTWEEAIFTFEKMKETYLGYGYEIIEVPKANVEERCDFVRRNIR